MTRDKPAKRKEEWSREHDVFEEQKATSVTSIQRTTGRLEDFTGVKLSRLWLGFSYILWRSGVRVKAAQ